MDGQWVDGERDRCRWRLEGGSQAGEPQQTREAGPLLFSPLAPAGLKAVATS